PVFENVIAFLLSFQVTIEKALTVNHELWA
ncbi:MAG: hypothetical protein ACI80I_003290, partial [Akkermansiaceae bacterium]